MMVAGTSGRRDAICELSDFPKNTSTSEFLQPAAGDRRMAHKAYFLSRLSATTFGQAAKNRGVGRGFPAGNAQLKGLLRREVWKAVSLVMLVSPVSLGFPCVVCIVGVEGY
jgi:hypothetical protein